MKVQEMKHLTQGGHRGSPNSRCRTGPLPKTACRRCHRREQEVHTCARQFSWDIRALDYREESGC